MTSDGNLEKHLFDCDFKSDCIYQLFFEDFTEAFFVLDLINDRFIDVNHKLAELAGYSKDELVNSDFLVSFLIHDEDKHVYQRNIVKSKTGKIKFKETEIIHMKIVTKSGMVEETEITVKRISMMGRVISFGQIRVITPFLTKLNELEKENKRKSEVVEKAELKTNQVIQDNVRLAEITERIMKTSIFSSYLEKCMNKDHLFETSTSFLTSSAGMSFQTAAIYILDKSKSRLELASDSSRKASNPKILEISERSPIFDLIQKRTKKLYLPDGTLAVPILRRNYVDGILLVKLDEMIVKMIFSEKQYRNTLIEILSNLANLIMYRLQNIELIEDLQQQTIVDQLTGAYNRGYFDKKLGREFSRSKRYRRDLSLILIDLDKFKDINDSYGHLQGDLMLQQFASLLISKTRDVDSVCRLGGDEFAIIMPETSLEKTISKAEELRFLVQNFIFTNMTNATKPLFITMSAGVIAINAELDTWEDLYRHADNALYKSKQDGRNLVSSI